MAKTNQREKMTQEIAIHQSLNHRHIVGFHGFFDDSNNIYIILELCRKRVRCSQRKLFRLPIVNLTQLFNILVDDGAAQAQEGTVGMRDTILHETNLGWSFLLASASNNSQRFKVRQPVFERRFAS